MRRILTAAVAAAVLVNAGCTGRPGTFPTGKDGSGRALAPHANLTLRLGFVAEITQA